MFELDAEYVDEIVKEAVEKVFDVESWGKDEDSEMWVFEGRFRIHPVNAANYLQNTFEPLKFFVAIRKLKDGKFKIVILKQRPVPKTKIGIHLLLLFATLITTFFWGATYEIGDFPKKFSEFLQGYKFALPLLLILGSHELGHFFVSRHHGVDATLPYFIPFPFNMIGTLGAFIKIRSPIPSRNVLIDIGAAGPIAGIIVAIPLTIIGLKTSEVVSIESAKGSIWLGEPLLFKLLSTVVIGGKLLTKGLTLKLSATAFAGWVGMFVTALNLIPVGQLDGGHISYAILGENAHKLSKIMVLLLVVLGFKWMGWLFWAILLLVLGVSHPAPMNDILPVDNKRKFIAFVSLLIFVLTFIPQPISFVGQ